MKKIIPDKYYSLTEIQKMIGIKSRQYLTKYFDDNLIKGIKTGYKKGIRYFIKGTEVSRFINKYKSGKIKSFYKFKKIKIK